MDGVNSGQLSIADDLKAKLIWHKTLHRRQLRRKYNRSSVMVMAEKRLDKALMENKRVARKRIAKRAK